MTLYKKILLLLIAAISLQVVVAQNDDEIYSNFERNYNELLQSYYMKTNEKQNNQNYSGTTYGRKKASELTDDEIKNRLKVIPSCVPLVYNSVVRNHIVYYIDRIGDRVGVMLGVSKYYFPIFENILDAYGVPSDLKYLVVIESAFNPKAVSRAGATGLWQFMYATGRNYDLRVNSIVDDRRDPIKSTIAAAQYLKDLYSIYHDWSLVLAAYNCGPGNVNKAIKRSGENDFWQIYSYLPKETRNYVPAFIAATYAMNYADKHGICAANLSKPLDLINDTVNVSRDIYFGQIEKVLGISIDQIKEMNPQYKMNYIPGTTAKYSLRLPLKNIEKFIELEDSIASTDTNVYNLRNLASDGTIKMNVNCDSQSDAVYITKTITHKVQSRESWSSIARRYGVSVSDLRKWNRKVKTNKLRKGTLLSVKQRVAVEKQKYIPQSESEKESIVEESITAADNENNQVEQITANNTNKSSVNNTSSKNKTNINSKTNNTKANTNNKKATNQKTSKTHTVKSGDTITKIAARYNTTVEKIMKLNNMDKKSADRLRLGQKIKVK